MKKILIFAASAAVCLGISSCAQELQDNGQTKVQTVSFSGTASVSLDTKTALTPKQDSGYTVDWQAGDSFCVNYGGYYNSASQATDNLVDVELSTDGSWTVSGVPVPENNSDGVLRAAYPHQSKTKINNIGGYFAYEIAASQTPGANGPDPATMVMFAQTEVDLANTTNVSLEFKTVVAYGKIGTITGVPADETVSSIEISAAENIVGTAVDYYYKAETPYYAVYSSGASKTITVSTNSLSNVWFTAAPGTYTGLTFTVNTESGKKYVKTASSPVTLQAGKVGNIASIAVSEVSASNINLRNTTASVELKVFSSFTGSGYHTVDDYEISGYTGFSVTDCMLSNSSLQMKASSGKLVSPTILTDAGYDVEVIYTSSANLSLKVGDTQAVTSASPLASGTSKTAAPFTITTGSKYGTISKIIITPKSTAPQISASDITIDAAMQQGEIQYSVTNPLSGTTSISYSVENNSNPDDEWFYDGSVLEDPMYFGATTNETSSDRYVDVKICYTDNVAYAYKTIRITQKAAPVIVASNMEVGADYAMHTLSYSIQNPVDGGQLVGMTVKSGNETEEWIFAGIDGPNDFGVMANESSEPRSAVVTLTYSNNNDVTVTKDVTITQQAAGGYILTFPDGNSENNKVSNYISTWTAKDSSNNEWTITNFHNNSWNSPWTYIKCGRKNDTSVATITTTVNKSISTVKIKIDEITSASVNSITLKTSTASDFSTTVETKTIEKSTGEQTITLNSPAASLYYKFEFDCMKSSSNGIIQVSRIELK